MLEPQAFEDVKTFLDDIIAYAVVTVDGEEIKGFFWKKPRKGFCTASHLSFWNRRCKPCTQKNSGLTM